MIYSDVDRLAQGLSRRAAAAARLLEFVVRVFLRGALFGLVGNGLGSLGSGSLDGRGGFISGLGFSGGVGGRLRLRTHTGKEVASSLVATGKLMFGPPTC